MYLALHALLREAREGVRNNLLLHGSVFGKSFMNDALWRRFSAVLVYIKFSRSGLRTFWNEYRLCGITCRSLWHVKLFCWNVITIVFSHQLKNYSLYLYKICPGAKINSPLTFFCPVLRGISVATALQFLKEKLCSSSWCFIQSVV